MKLRHTFGVIVELTVKDEPTVMRRSAREQFCNVEQRITELRALLAKGNQALNASRELLTQLAQLECRWADWYANGLIKASATGTTTTLAGGLVIPRLTRTTGE